MKPVPELRDLAGVQMTTGTKVAWYIGGRYGSGMVLGVVSRMDVETRQRRRYDPPTRSYIDEEQDVLVVDLKPLVKGRKLRTMTLNLTDGIVNDQHGGRDVVVIANQEYGED